MNKIGAFQKEGDYRAGTRGARAWAQAGLRNQYKDSGCATKTVGRVLIRSVMQTDFLLLCGEWIVEMRILLPHP